MLINFVNNYISQINFKAILKEPHSIPFQKAKVSNSTTP